VIAALTGVALVTCGTVGQVPDEAPPDADATVLPPFDAGADVSFEGSTFEAGPLCPNDGGYFIAVTDPMGTIVVDGGCPDGGLWIPGPVPAIAVYSPGLDDTSVLASACGLISVQLYAFIWPSSNPLGSWKFGGFTVYDADGGMCQYQNATMNVWDWPDAGGMVSGALVTTAPSQCANAASVQFCVQRQ